MNAAGKIIFLMLCFSFEVLNVQAQYSEKIRCTKEMLAEIKITKQYDGALDEVLHDIAVDKKLFMSFDKVKIHSIHFNESFTEASLGEVLDIICTRCNLNYHLDEGIIVLETNKQTGDPETDANDYYIEEKKTFKGPPKAFNITISGKIKDITTGESLPYANIFVAGTKIGTVTNSDGFFTLLKVPTDTSTLEVIFMGYRNKKIFLTPEMPKSNLIVEITPKFEQLAQVDIIGVKDKVVTVTSEVSDVKMLPKEIALLPSVGEKDIMRSFQLLPGISGSNESSSGLYVRGGTPDQNLVLFDGFTVYHVDHLYGFFSAFNSNAIKDIQLYKGGFEARFGGRLSSVTEITGKEGNQKKLAIGGELSLLSANLYVETPLGKKMSLLVAGRKSYKGPIYNKIFEKFNIGAKQQNNFKGSNMQSTSNTVTSYFYDVNTKLTYKPSDNDIISFSFYNGADKLDNSRESGSSFGVGNDFNMNVNDLTNFGNIGGAVRWSKKWNNKLYGNTILGYSNYYSKRDRTNERTFTNDDGEEETSKFGNMENNDLKDLSVKTDYQWDIFKGSQLGFGYFATYNDIRYQFSQNDTVNILDKHETGINTGVYLQDKFRFFKEKLTLMPGIRYTYFSNTNGFYYEPRFSANYSLTEKIKLKVATGKYYQFINRVIREDISSGSRDFWILADNDKVPVSSALHYIAGIGYETKNYVFDVEAYYKNLDGLTEYSLRFKPKPGSIDYSENFYQGTGIAKGIEFLAQKNNGNINGWIGYTLAQVLYNFPVYSDESFPALQDVTHEFKIVTIYKYKRWDFASTWIYATGRPYTAPEGGYQLTLLDGTTKDFINVGKKNGLRLPDYHRLDISANLHLYNQYDKDIGSISFSIFNLYARKNVWYKEYEISDGNVVETNVNYLGFTPNVTLSLKIK